MPGRLEWLGDEVLARVVVAAAEGIDATTKAAADDARSHHWWTARSGSAGLEGQVINEAAKIEGTHVVGRFGSSLRRAGFYGLFLEMKQPWLRPAADRHFPHLPYFIRKAARWT